MLYVSLYHGANSIAVTNRVAAWWSETAVLPYVVDLSELRIAQSARSGGWYRGEYGTITLLPNTFSETAVDFPDWWPPPTVIEQVSIAWYPGDGVTPFVIPVVLTGWLESWDTSGVTYSLRRSDDYEETVIDRWYDGTLANAFSEVCTALGLTANYGWARSPSPDVDYRAMGETSVLENLTAMCAFFSHRFYISGSTAYLIDSMADAVDNAVLTSADIRSVEYLQPAPVKRVVGAYSPPYVKRIKLEFQERQDAGTSVVLAEFDVAKYYGGALINADALIVSAYQSGYPSTNLWDDNNATVWISGADTVPGVTLTAQVVYGQICEYAMTAYTSDPDYSPVRWSLYGYNGWTGEYEYIGNVESLDWTAGEQRRFSVPDPITWQIQVENTYGSNSLGDEYEVNPVCHTNHTLITEALEDVVEEITRPRCRYTLPIQEIIPSQKVTLMDTTTVSGEVITSWIRVESLTYDFNQGIVTVEGGGEWA